LPAILQRCAIDPPSIMALIISAAILSKRSAPRAAQSPTLSPTLKSKQNQYGTDGSTSSEKKSIGRKNKSTSQGNYKH